MTLLGISKSGPPLRKRALGGTATISNTTNISNSTPSGFSSMVTSQISQERSGGAAAFSDHQQQEQCNGSDGTVSRSLDEFVEQSYRQTSSYGGIGGGIRRQWQYWAVILSLGVANSSDATEILCISYILSDAKFETEFLNEGGDSTAGSKAGMLAAAVFFGMLVGGLLFGTLGDWVGRRPVLLLGLFGNAVAGLLSACAPTVGILTMLRCLAGVGIGATVPPLFTMAAELAPPSKRGLCVTLCATFWMVGSVFVALAAMWILQHRGSSWRIFAIVCAIPSLVGAALVIMLVPESPRYLALNQRHAEALVVVNTLVTKMDYRGPLLTLEEVEKSFPNHHLHDKRMYQTEYGACGMIRTAMRDFVISAQTLYTPQLRQTTWPLKMAWFALSFGSYGLVTWINTIFVEVQLENVYFNSLLFAASNLPGNIIAMLWMDQIGRSSMLIGSILLGCMGLVSFAFFTFNLNPVGIVISSCIFQCFTTTAWNTIDTMTSELFPTTVRSTGMGVCAASGRVGAMMAQFVNGALVAQPVRLLLISSGTLLLGALTPCLISDADMTGQPVHDDVDPGGDQLRQQQQNVLYSALSAQPPPQQVTHSHQIETTATNGSKTTYQHHFEQSFRTSSLGV